MQTLSVLRYPGGKSRAIETVFSLIPKDTKKLCSPFFGGGSIELYCASRGITVYGYDLFSPLVNFWKCMNKDSERLAEKIELLFGKIPKLNKNDFYDLQKNHREDFSIKDYEWEKAAIFFVLNRSSFCGSTLSGGMSPNHPRFNKQSVERVRNFNVKNFSIECTDFEKAINKHPNTLLYLDPPYLIKNCLYGKKGSTHRGFEHERLCSLLKQRKNWILSYNDNPEILEMYAGFEVLRPQWKYGMSSNKNSKEVIILGEK